MRLCFEVAQISTYNIFFTVSGGCLNRHALLSSDSDKSQVCSCHPIETYMSAASTAFKVFAYSKSPPIATALINSAMCTSRFVKGATCDHTWTEIVTPCAEGKGFGNCSSFNDGKIRKGSGLKRYRAPEEFCPTCDKKGDYDGNLIRTIKATTYGGVWGFQGASKSAPGLHCVLGRQKSFPRKKPEPVGIVCCVVM